MRITLRVFRDQTDLLQHFRYAILDEFLVANAADLQALCDNFAYRHTGVQRTDRVLEDHLDLGHQITVNNLILFQGFHRLRIACGFRFGILLFPALHRFDAHADALAAEEYVAVRDLIQTDDRTSGRGFAAAGFSDETEYLAFIDDEADVVDRLGVLEVLFQMLNAENGLLFGIKVGRVVVHPKHRVELIVFQLSANRLLTH